MSQCLSFPTEKIRTVKLLLKYLEMEELGIMTYAMPPAHPGTDLLNWSKKQGKRSKKKKKSPPGSLNPRAGKQITTVTQKRLMAMLVSLSLCCWVYYRCCCCSDVS